MMEFMFIVFTVPYVPFGGARSSFYDPEDLGQAVSDAVVRAWEPNWRAQRVVPNSTEQPTTTPQPGRGSGDSVCDICADSAVLRN